MSDSQATSQSPVAMVTGASSGIGKAFCERLASLRYDLVLVSRDRNRLSILADTLRDTYDVDVEVHCADLSDEDEIRGLERRIARTPNLRMLVNNAGFLTRGRFVDTDVEQQADMVRVHDVSAVRLCHAAVRRMVGSENVQDGKLGPAIINVSSVASFGTSEENITYCATKAFLTSFSRGLDLELRDHRIRIQALCPGYTRTEIHQRAGAGDDYRAPGFLWCSVEEVVDASLRALEKGKVVCVPGAVYKVATFFARFLPSNFQNTSRRLEKRLRRRNTE
jgi:uncharacterized protein